MPIHDSFLKEYDQEMAATRRLLERVPLAEADWKPHAKSMDLGNLAAHLVEIPAWVTAILEGSSHDLMAGRRGPRSRYSSTQEMLTAFDQNVVKARTAIAAKSDEEMTSTWTLKRGDKILVSTTKAAMLQAMLMNHLIHHRGQCTVYLRLKDVPVPALYGPSADEPLL